MEEESLRVDLALKFREKEMSLLQSLVGGLRTWTAALSEMGVVLKLVLAGAGGLVFLWGGSSFVWAVVRPFWGGRRGERGRWDGKGGRRRRESGRLEEGEGEEEGDE